MNTIQLIKSKKRNRLHYIITWLYVISGSKLFMDYLLITNPISYNPIIRFLYGWAKPYYSVKSTSRYTFCYFVSILHLGYFILNIMTLGRLTIFNVLINLYPIITNLYIGYRLYMVRNKLSIRK